MYDGLLSLGMNFSNRRFLSVRMVIFSADITFINKKVEKF